MLYLFRGIELLDVSTNDHMLLLLAHSESACFREHDTTWLSLGNLYGEDADDTHRLETVSATLAHMLYELQSQMNVNGVTEVWLTQPCARSRWMHPQRKWFPSSCPRARQTRTAFKRSPVRHRERTLALPFPGQTKWCPPRRRVEALHSEQFDIFTTTGSGEDDFDEVDVSSDTGSESEEPGDLVEIQYRFDGCHGPLYLSPLRGQLHVRWVTCLTQI